MHAEHQLDLNQPPASMQSVRHQRQLRHKLRYRKCTPGTGALYKIITALARARALAVLLIYRRHPHLHTSALGVHTPTHTHPSLPSFIRGARGNFAIRIGLPRGVHSAIFRTIIIIIMRRQRRRRSGDGSAGDDTIVEVSVCVCVGVAFACTRGTRGRQSNAATRKSAC